MFEEIGPENQSDSKQTGINAVCGADGSVLSLSLLTPYFCHSLMLSVFCTLCLSFDVAY